ncbi:helix-turn-helix domain-containing protein [Henriciella mobilis]|uniref:DNA-binding protein n=1 Tax=Henriciella mobilis TaxID=2305467 RepID=A0A399R9M6_9PROT|nr:helix-turn-helix domain-containing protein [Henriciella mobilis]RIJ26382.1 DNA-binding protein [Henriciella mobilis]
MSDDEDKEYLDLLTPDEVSEMLGVKTHRLAEWRMGQGNVNISYLKIGKYVRYRRRDILDFLKSQRRNYTIERK